MLSRHAIALQGLVYGKSPLLVAVQGLRPFNYTPFPRVYNYASVHMIVRPGELMAVRRSTTP